MLLRSTLLLAAVSLAACSTSQPRTDNLGVAEFEEITVKRINVVGEDGSFRLVLSNEDRFPAPIMHGDTIDARTIEVAGMLVYKLNGDEAGGIGTTGGDGAPTQVFSILDYSNSDGLITGIQDAGESGYAGIVGIRERQPLGVSPLEAEGGSAGPMRVMLANQNGAAMLVLNDGEERPRLRLTVTEDGAARVEVLDEEGNTVDSLPREE